MSQFEAVLGECLDALFRGATVEKCLARHPDQADELAPLLGLAAHIAQTRPLTMPQVGFERGRTRVRAAVAQMRAERASTTPPHGPIRALVARLSRQEHQPERSSTGWLDALLLTAIGLAVAVLVIVSSPIGSPLYPARQAVERAVLVVRSAPDRIADWLQGTPSPINTPLPMVTESPAPVASPPDTIVAPTAPLTTDTPQVRPTALAVTTATPTSPSGSTASTTMGGTPTWTPGPVTNAPPHRVTPSLTQTAALTGTPLPTSMATYAASATLVPSPTHIPSPTPTLTWTAEPPSATPSPTKTPVPTHTSSPSPTPTVPLTQTPRTSPSPTTTPTPPPTDTPLPTATAPPSSELSPLRLVDEAQLTRREYVIFRAWSTDGQRILFTAPQARYGVIGDPKDQEIWVMNRDGSDQRQVAVGQSPTFAPDGQRVAYTAGETEGRAVWVVAVADGEPQRVVGGAGRQVFWPTENTLLYATAEGLKAVTLTTTDIGSTEPELRVPLAGLVEANPEFVQWSVAPDGSAAVFGIGSRWWLARTEPGKAPQLQALPVKITLSHAWTRDGTAFAFSGAEGSLDSGIYLLGTDGASGPRLVVPMRRLGDGSGGLIQSLTWAPDGSMLAVEWWSGSRSERSSVYLVDRGGHLQILTGPGEHEVLHWSPDGQMMAFHRNGNIWLAHVEGP